VARKRFVLIDQSIAGLAGHHHEYAVHVLRAARRAGYEPVLATNIAFAETGEKLPWKTIPVYHHGYWESEGAPRFDVIAALLRGVSNVRFRARFAKRYSLAGLLWSVRDNLTGFIGLQMLRRGDPVGLLPLVVLAVILKTARFLITLALLPVALLVFLWRFALRLLRFGRFPKSYARNLTADVRDAGTFVHRLFEQRLVWMQWLQRRRHRDGFRKDTATLLHTIGAGQGDVIFVPTISATEMAGLADLLAEGGTAAEAEWRLLFRRNLFPGRDLKGDLKDQHTLQVEQAFQESAAKLRGARVRFYTDTEELTRQYNQMNLFEFQTVPIPHTHQALEPRRGESPLRILYMGDARSEKGYHFIPDLIENLWDDYVASGKVEFHLQSNFNIPQGEPKAVIARQRLEALAAKAPGAVRLYTDPFTSDEYRELLLSGDLNLLFYEPGNYFARSSGILVESLSAGIPVIAPAATWLTRQFREPVTEWQRLLPEQMIVVRERTAQQLRWRAHGNPDANQSEGGELLITTAAPTYSWVRVPPGSSYLLMRLAAKERESGELRVYVDQIDTFKASLPGAVERIVETDEQGRAVLLLPIHRQAVRLWLSLKPAKAGASERLKTVEIFFLAPRPGHAAPPLSVIGSAYDDPGEIEWRLRELLDHHAHYAATARAFATGWRERHNAARLVEVLEGSTGAAEAKAVQAAV
jgi:hypothetical protein